MRAARLGRAGRFVTDGWYSMKLDIACGQRKRGSFIGIDISPLPEVDIVHDLEVFPWPIDSDSVEEAYCSHYIEHTPSLINFMNELYRVLKPGAFCTILAPYYTWIGAWQDPTHTRAISENTFLYFNAAWRKKHWLEHYPIHCDFECALSFGYLPEWVNRPEQERNFALRHYFNVVAEIQAKLTKR